MSAEAIESKTIPMSATRKAILSVCLLVCSNAFMNTAWYAHLKFKSAPIWLAIVASWGIAFLEYCFQVPANRIGNDVMSVTQLKVTQEVITLVTFAIFSTLVFKERLTINHGIAFVLLIGAAYFAVKK
jgi:uncharacterized protein